MVLQGSYLPFVHSFCARLVTCILTLIPCLHSVPSLSHLCLVVLGKSAGLSKIFILMMHPSRDSGPPFLPKLNWFHYEGSIKCDSHSLQVVDMLSEMLPTYNQPKTATLSNRHLNAAKIVTHARYELTDYLYVRWDDLRRLVWIWAFDLFSDDTRGGVYRRTHVPPRTFWIFDKCEVGGWVYYIFTDGN